MRWLWVCAGVLLVPLAAWAEMPSEANIKAVADAWLAKKPAPGFGATMTMAEAANVQVRYTALIAKDLGGMVGYKAGLTNPAVQKGMRVTVRYIGLTPAPAEVTVTFD
ncbi:MAG: hypothetical protein HY713_04080 [candidate division NC10 bacterium]|nr:hypothetical protein [candidate division NC10 bacterium]